MISELRKKQISAVLNCVIIKMRTDFFRNLLTIIIFAYNLRRTFLRRRKNIAYKPKITPLRIYGKIR